MVVMENPTENRIFGGYLYFRKPQFRGVPGVPHFQSSRHNCSALVADLKQFQRLQRSGEGLVLRARWINWIDEWRKMITIVNKNMFFFQGTSPSLSAFTGSSRMLSNFACGMAGSPNLGRIGMNRSHPAVNHTKPELFDIFPNSGNHWQTVRDVESESS